MHALILHIYWSTQTTHYFTVQLDIYLRVQEVYSAQAIKPVYITIFVN